MNDVITLEGVNVTSDNVTKEVVPEKNQVDPTNEKEVKLFVQR